MKRTICVIAAVAVLVTLSGCTASGGSSGKASTVNFAINADPGNINPITAATQAGEQVTAFSYESLVTLPPGKQPVGLIAKSWTESNDQITFTIKPGVTCSDGTALTASDVAATFAYAAKSSTASPFAGVYFPAQGLTVSADNSARTVTFKTATPESFLLQTIGSLPIVCPAGLKDPKLMNTRTFGTGPYVLSKSSPGQSYSFTLRSGYTWGPNGVTSKTADLPQKVDVQVVVSQATQANLLQSGQLQYATVAGTQRDRLDKGGYSTINVPLQPGLVFFNQAPGRPANDLAVRQAIGDAINRPAVGKVASEGHGQLLDSLVSTFGSVCIGKLNSSSALPALDVAKANKLLDAAGWVKGSDGVRSKDGKKLTMVLLYPTTAGDGVEAAIELIQQELAKVGVDAVPTPSSSYTDVIFQGGNWDMVWAPIFSTLPSDWQGILSGEFPPNGGNWTYNTNQQFFTLAATAQKKAGEASCSTWKAAQDSLFTNLEVLPISSSTTTMYGSGLTFGLSNTVVMPTTLRVTK